MNFTLCARVSDMYVLVHDDRWRNATSTFLSVKLPSHMDAVWQAVANPLLLSWALKIGKPWASVYILVILLKKVTSKKPTL